MADFMVSSSLMMSPLASIASQVPAGLSEARTLAREVGGEGSNSPKQIVTSDLPSSASNQSRQLNSQPALPIQDTSNSSANKRSSSSDSADTGSTQQTQQVDSEAQSDQAKIDQVLSQLKARDQEVRAHEQAHMAAAGGYATGMSFSYQTGPDGNRYAIGGEVGIDTSPIANDPQATIIKAQIIQRAAMAPAEPSSQDYRVAGAAAQMMVQAQQALAELDSEEQVSDQSETSSAEQTAKVENNTQDGREANSISSSIESSQTASSSTDISTTEPVMLSERGAFELRQQLQPNLVEASR